MLDVHERVSLQFAAAVARITAADWERPTPCAEWNVRALVDHVVRWNTFVPEFLAGKSLAEMDRPFERDVLTAVPAQAAMASAQAAIAAFNEPGALDRTVHHAIGDIPAQYALFLRLSDNAIHGWDLARAIGADDTIDPAAVALIYEFAANHRGELRASGAFGSDEVEVPNEADLQTRLLGILGRTTHEPG